MKRVIYLGSILIVILLSMAIWRYGVRIITTVESGGYNLTMGVGRWLYQSGVLGAYAGSRRVGSVQIVMTGMVDGSFRCVRVDKAVPPLYCVRERDGVIWVFVDEEVYGKVSNDKRRLGINLILGEELYQKMGGDEERYWEMYQKIPQKQMWEVRGI